MVLTLEMSCYNANIFKLFDSFTYMYISLFVYVCVCILFILPLFPSHYLLIPAFFSPRKGAYSCLFFVIIEFN